MRLWFPYTTGYTFLNKRFPTDCGRSKSNIEQTIGQWHWTLSSTSIRHLRTYAPRSTPFNHVAYLPDSSTTSRDSGRGSFRTCKQGRKILRHMIQNTRNSTNCLVWVQVCNDVDIGEGGPRCHQQYLSVLSTFTDKCHIATWLKSDTTFESNRLLIYRPCSYGLKHISNIKTNCDSNREITWIATSYLIWDVFGSSLWAACQGSTVQISLNDNLW